MTKTGYLHRLKLNIGKLKDAGVEHIHYCTKLAFYVNDVKPSIERLGLMDDVKALTIEGPIGNDFDYGYVEFDLPLEAAIKFEMDDTVVKTICEITKM